MALQHIKYYLFYIDLDIDLKQGGKQMAPQLAPLGSMTNGGINYWVNEGSSIILPCFSYGNPPPLTRYADFKGTLYLTVSMCEQWRICIP